MKLGKGKKNVTTGDCLIEVTAWAGLIICTNVDEIPFQQTISNAMTFYIQRKCGGGFIFRTENVNLQSA